jgi:uncharacterized protein (DUF427 family)
MRNRIEPQPGQESVWDYPRPPRVEATSDRIVIEFGGVVLVDTTNAVRVLETSHPPVYYVPIDAIASGSLEPARVQSFCEFKGLAGYFTIVGPKGLRAENAAWYYADPTAGYEALKDRVAIYPSAMDTCTVNGEIVQSQEGDFYGGWITSKVVGPFKGAPGTLGW